MIKKYFVLLLVHIMFVVAVYGENSFEGELLADIDHDGKQEMVQWNKFMTTDVGEFFQLRVIDDNGEVIWQGPKETSDTNPYVFTALDYGISLPELLMDIDQDGNVELIAPELQSDVSPTLYRRLRWGNGTFDLLQSYALISSSQDRETFQWVTPKSSYGTWVSDFIDSQEYGNGLAKARITQYNKDGSSGVGEVLVRFFPGGAKIEKWIKPLAVNQKFQNWGSNQSAIHYQARLSSSDHLNSRGKRLDTIIDIIRQDRANFYKGQKDKEDQKDEIFQNYQARSKLLKYTVVPVGQSYATLKKMILHGEPIVKIKVLPPHIYIEIKEYAK